MIFYNSVEQFIRLKNEAHYLLLRWTCISSSCNRSGPKKWEIECRSSNHDISDIVKDEGVKRFKREVAQYLGLSIQKEGTVLLIHLVDEVQRYWQLKNLKDDDWK